MKQLYFLLLMLLVGCHHDEPTKVVIEDEEEFPTLAYDACNSPSFFYSSTDAAGDGLSGNESFFVGTHYCPVSIQDVTIAEFTDYTSTVNDNSVTLVTMTSTQALNFCRQAYAKGQVAIDSILIGGASTNASTPLEPDSLVQSPYNWPQNSNYIALSLFDLVQYSLFDLAPTASGVDSVGFATATDHGLVVCFVPEN